MNMIYFGAFIIIVGVAFACRGITSELDDKVKVKEGVKFVTVDEGVLLEKYMLEGATFGDGTPGSVYIIGYKEKIGDDSVDKLDEE